MHKNNATLSCVKYKQPKLHSMAANKYISNTGFPFSLRNETPPNFHPSLSDYAKRYSPNVANLDKHILCVTPTPPH